MLPRGRPVAIEIGPQSVRVAQLADRRGAVRVVRFAEQELPSGVRWEVGGDRGPVVQAIRQALARAGIRARSAVISLPRGQVTARVGAFPPAERDELQRVVEYDLADHIPFPVDQVVVDFQQLGPSRDQPGLIDALVVAVPRELVREHLRVAEDLRLRVSAVTIDALALDDLARMTGREPAGISVAIEVGARATIINVMLQGALRLTRSVAAGGNLLVRAIQDDFAVDPQEAQRMRESDGLLLLQKAPKPGALRAWVDNLLGEIRRSALSFGPARVTRFVLIGAESTTPGLKELLGREFAVEPVLLSAVSAFPHAEFWGTDPQTADRCVLAMGAALQGIGKSAWTLSLVPPEVQRARRQARVRQLAAAGVVAVLAVMVGLYLLTTKQVDAQQLVPKDLRAKVKGTETQRAKAQAILAERDRLTGQMKSLDIVPVRRYATLELLRAVSLYSPNGISLTHFTLKPDQPLELRGQASDPAAVAELQQTISLSPLIKGASLTGIDRVVGRGPIVAHLTFSMQLHLWIEKEAEPRAVTLRRQGGSR